MRVNVKEYHRGLTRSSNYYFVVKGNELVHISHYAVAVEKGHGDSVNYVIDLNKIGGDRVVEIVTTNSGPICSAFVFPPKELGSEERHREVKPLSIINNLRLTYLKPKEISFLHTEWRKYYVPMIDEIKEFIKGSKSYVGLPPLIQCQVESGANYPLSYLIPYSEVARGKSLDGLTKEVHQIWITMLILKYLASRGVLKSANFLIFKQSSYEALASFSCVDGVCSLWYEFDMNPISMCEGMLWRETPPQMVREFYDNARKVLRSKRLGRVPLRPDLVIIGEASRCDEFKGGFKVRALIECKNQDYSYWAKDVDTQIIPYKEIFRPDTMIVASLKKVSPYVKERLGRSGIILIDDVFPGGKGVGELVDVLELLLG